MAETKKIKDESGTKKDLDLKVKKVTDTTEELAGFVKDNYLAGLEISVSIWNENLKIMNNQIDNWLVLQRNYANSMKDVVDRFYGNGMKTWNGGLKNPLILQTELYISLQNSYVDSMRGVLSKFPKEAVAVSQRNVEAAFSVFDNYLSFFEGYPK